VLQAMTYIYPWKKTAILFGSLLVLLWGWTRCGKAPSPLPPTSYGSIRVTAMDTTVIDSITVFLDDVSIGKQPNPCLISYIVEGRHKVFASHQTGSATPQTVEVKRDWISDVLFQILSVGPYPGSSAPSFEVIDIQGNGFSLDAQKGKVVFLLFFEHT
jgi:hypothetical protein